MRCQWISTKQRPNIYNSQTTFTELTVHNNMRQTKITHPTNESNINCNSLVPLARNFRRAPWWLTYLRSCKGDQQKHTQIERDRQCPWRSQKVCVSREKPPKRTRRHTSHINSGTSYRLPACHAPAIVAKHIVYLQLSGEYILACC